MEGPISSKNARRRWSRVAETPIRGPRWMSHLAGRILVPGWNDLVGVDVSESSVKLVRIRRRGGTPHVNVAAQAVTDKGRIPEVLRELVASAGFRGVMAATTVTGNDVVVRRVSLPDMRGADLASAIKLECRKHVTGSLDETEIRYEVLGRTERDGAPTVDVLVTLASRRRVEEARELLEQAGLKPVCVTIRPVALTALLGGQVDPEEVVAYLDLGAAASHVSILKGKEIRFARELGVGGAAFTDALRSIVVPGQGTVELSMQEAEELKRTHGIPFGADEAGAANGIPLTAVSVMLRPVLERLVRELWNSFDYVNEQFLGESVTQVVLLGEGSRVKNLAEYLVGVLKIPVTRADRYEGAPLPAEGPNEGSAPLSELGLGLASLDRSAMNFLAPPEAGTAYLVASAVPQRAAAAIAAVLLLSVSLPAEMAVMGERQRVSSLRSSLDEVRPRAEALRRFRAARDEETRLHDLLARLSGDQVLWSYVLRDLSWRVGDEARLTTLEVVEPAPAAGAAVPAGVVSGREVRLSGLLRTDRGRPEKVLGELMQSLSRSPVFDQVRLEGCQTVTPALSSFTVTVRIAEVGRT